LFTALALLAAVAPVTRFVDRLLWRGPTGCNGSGTARPLNALNGGSTVHTSRSRLDDCIALLSGRAVESHQCRPPANCGRSMSQWNFLVSSR